MGARRFEKLNTLGGYAQPSGVKNASANRRDYELTGNRFWRKLLIYAKIISKCADAIGNELYSWLSRRLTTAFIMGPPDTRLPMIGISLQT
jgi:hypothetical protein